MGTQTRAALGTAATLRYGPTGWTVHHTHVWGCQLGSDALASADRLGHKPASAARATCHSFGPRELSGWRTGLTRVSRTAAACRSVSDN